MEHHSEALIGIDTAKLHNTVAIVEAGGNGEIRCLGEVDAGVASDEKGIRFSIISMTGCLGVRTKKKRT